MTDRLFSEVTAAPKDFPFIYGSIDTCFILKYFSNVMISCFKSLGVISPDDRQP